MIYVVSGYRRSGTSMLMRALADGLESGGILYQENQEKIGSEEADGYLPNPSGLLEVGQVFYKNASFLRGIPDESLLKIHYDGLANLPAGDWVVIYMHRDEEEIRASCDRVDRHLRQVGVQENPEKAHTFDVFRPYRKEDIDHVLGIMRQRRDVRLIEVNFRDVIEDPVASFEAIRCSPLGKVQVPINVERAAAVVKPELYRFRKEDAHNEVSNARPCADSTDQAVKWA